MTDKLYSGYDNCDNCDIKETILNIKEKDVVDWTCSYCRKIMRKIDKEQHEQHQQMLAKLKINFNYVFDCEAGHRKKDICFFNSLKDVIEDLQEILKRNTGANNS